MTSRALLRNIYGWQEAEKAIKTKEMTENSRTSNDCCLTRILDFILKPGGKPVRISGKCFTVTTVFVDTRLWKTKHPRISVSLKMQLFKLAIRRNKPPFQFIDRYATLENKTPALTFPKFPSVLRVIDRLDRNPPIAATGVTF